ncbi:MAG: hypothetical protein Q9167_006718 [Letrouitia subvulpina]
MSKSPPFMAQSSEEFFFGSQKPQEQHICHYPNKRHSVIPTRDAYRDLGQEVLRCFVDKKGTISVTMSSDSNPDSDSDSDPDSDSDSERFESELYHDDSNGHTSTDQLQVVQKSARLASEILSDDDSSVLTAIESFEIRIGDDEAVERFFNEKVSQIPQQDLKGILKAWISAIEVKKQSRHPYNGGSKARQSKLRYGEEHPGAMIKPCYWPDSGCRHKEPDHLKKKERVILAKHLLGSEGVVVDTLRKSTEVLLSLEPEKIKLLGDIYDADSTVLIEKAETKKKVRSSHKVDQEVFQGITKVDPKSAGKRVWDTSPFDFQGSNNITISSYGDTDAPSAASKPTVLVKNPQTERKAPKFHSNTKIVAAEGQPGNKRAREKFQDNEKAKLKSAGHNIWDFRFESSFYPQSSPSATFNKITSYSYGPASPGAPLIPYNDRTQPILLDEQSFFYSNSTGHNLKRSLSVQHQESSSFKEWKSTRKQDNHSDDMGGQNSGVAMPIVSYGYPLSGGAGLQDILGSSGALYDHQYPMNDGNNAFHQQHVDQYGMYPLPDAESRSEHLLNCQESPAGDSQYPWF